jgi:hypothetical protein
MPFQSVLALGQVQPVLTIVDEVGEKVYRITGLAVGLCQAQKQQKGKAKSGRYHIPLILNT